MDVFGCLFEETAFVSRIQNILLQKCVQLAVCMLMWVACDDSDQLIGVCFNQGTGVCVWSTV